MSRNSAARNLFAARLRHAWEEVQSSYWFVPSVMSVAAVGLALGMLAIDRNVITGDDELSWIYSGDGEGARSVLSTIAGSMVTVAGVVFSITIVVLSLASSQYGPRLLKNFLRDRGNEVVLGTFLATFLYCLLVLRAVESDGANGAFVPQLAVTVGVGTAVLSLMVLIYFIHHVAAIIRVENIVHAATRDVDRTVDEVFPGSTGFAAEVVAAPPDETEWRPEAATHPPYVVTADRAGYIQNLDGTGMIGIATDADVVIQLDQRPGDFLVIGQPVARLWRRRNGDADLRALADEVRDRLFIGRQRTAQHDMVTAVERLTEIAARALSPGINDPYTAINCIDELSAGLTRLAGKEVPDAYRFDREGRLRLIAQPFAFSDVLTAAYGPLRTYGAGHAAVVAALFRALERVARCTDRQDVHAAVRAEGEAIIAAARRAEPIDTDRWDAEAQHARLQAALR